MKKTKHILIVSFFMMAITMLVSCAGSQTPEIQTVEVTVETVREVEVTVEVETIKEVEVEVEKEVEVVVTATPEMAEMSEEMDSSDKNIVINEVFWPTNGFAIESDDAFAFTRWGMTETLVKVDFNSQIVPGLATEWVARDETTWEFTIRPDVVFHNGEVLNAAAVVTALNHVIQSETPPRGIDPESILSIEAEGEDIVVVSLASPDVLFPNRLSAPSFGILAPAAYDSTPPDLYGTGTGPFVLEEIVPDQSASLVRNDAYWGGDVKLESALVLSTPDGDVRSTMLRTGEIDIANHLPISQLPLILDDEELNVVRSSQPRTVTVYLNNQSGPMSDVNVRRAVSHAINRQLLVDAILEGVGQAAQGPFVPTQAWAADDISVGTFNPEEAKALLEEAGYAEGELSLRLWTYPSRPSQPPLAVAMQQMLGDVGIATEIRIAPYGALESDVLAGDFDMFIVSRGHLIDGFDPEGFLASDFGCEGGYNLAAYCNPAVDALLDEVKELSDLDARYEKYAEIQNIIANEDVVHIWLTHTQQLYGHNSHVVGYQAHLLDYYLLTAELDLQ